MNNPNDLQQVLDLLLDAESRLFYLYADEADRFKKGRRKVIHAKVREACEELNRVIEKEAGEA